MVRGLVRRVPDGRGHRSGRADRGHHAYCPRRLLGHCPGDLSLSEPRRHRARRFVFQFWLSRGPRLGLKAGRCRIQKLTYEGPCRDLPKFFTPVGDDKTISANVRIVAATNRNLEEEIKAGRFREDLYYRLSVFPIQIPSLRERKYDILPLTQHLLESICRSMGKTPFVITRQQGELLQSLPWPGNVRELRNVLERAIILSKGSRLRLDLALPVQAGQTIPQPDANAPIGSSEFLTDVEFQQREKQNLVAALEHAGWRVSGEGGAADLLGIKASTLTYRMKALAIEKPKS
jgi:transcriptional regulator with GAF, ATPase, and Fis domain